MTLDVDLSRCTADLSRGPTHGTINFYVRREATIGELLRILDALGNDTTVVRGTTISRSCAMVASAALIASSLPNNS